MTKRTTLPFALSLYRVVRNQPGNVAVSPLSVATSLAMTWLGAAGETAAEMGRVLQAGDSADEAASAIGAFLRDLQGKDEAYVFRAANRLFAERTYSFEAPILERIRAAFGASLETLDFRGRTEAARVHINEWVARETENRIRDLIPPSGVDEDTRLVLANALYFLGKWERPFAASGTRPAPFRLANGNSKSVPTMHGREWFRYAALDGLRVLEMAYREGRCAMTFVLPDAADGLAELEARLTSERLDRWTGALTNRVVDVALPKFTVDPLTPLRLRPALAALGMPLAFDIDCADFTRLANPPRADDRLCISDVFHKVFVRVDEKGTEAAAATAVVMMTRGGGPPPEAEEFKADHPFLFLLRDTRTDEILFLGRVNEP